jgi:hypothetical protein
VSESKAKQHDVEETPRDTARRLLTQAVLGKAGDTGLTARWDVLDKTIHRHGRYFSASDQRELIEWIERRAETTRTLLEGVGEAPMFSLSSELLDELDVD